ncbi:hypothetical protein [Rubripirellula reticaptiva]|uniref:hypothetical protein n=1 Tax=Rubripirellula reticaptiva TaxID=2528013 RepID=UPI0011B5A508|nr:hypothetical protein [Rubripirellula reticaptiva]
MIEKQSEPSDAYFRGQRDRILVIAKSDVPEAAEDLMLNFWEEFVATAVKTFGNLPTGQTLDELRYPHTNQRWSR